MKDSLIWTPYANLFLGVWLISGSVTFGYESSPLIFNDLICGLLLVLAGGLSRSQKHWWLPWSIGLIGVWLQLAPLVFWGDAAAYCNDTLIGALAIFFALLIPPLPKQLPDDGPSIPPGWTFNPSSWAQRIPIAAFAFLGWFLSRYLAAYQLGHIDTVWDPVFHGTEHVLTSAVSQKFPVSDAGLGAAAYALEALLTCQGGERRWRTSPWMVVLFGILVIPTGLISILLIISQPLVVGAWCFLCLITALCSLLPIPLALDEVFAVLQYVRYSKEKPKIELFLYGGVCPHASIDRRSPLSSSPMKELLKASLWGVTLPWNLILSAILGIAIMFFSRIFALTDQANNFDDVLGPCIVVVSLIATSELARAVRWLNVPLAVLLLLSLWFGSCTAPEAYWTHLALNLIVLTLAFRKGPTKEQTTFLIN
jgi:uncharacterized membrane protein